VTADGDVVVPIDPEAFGFWLKAAFSEPITSGAGPWTHQCSTPTTGRCRGSRSKRRWPRRHGSRCTRAACSTRLGEDVTETLEVIPRRWKVVQTVSEKLTCRYCERISRPPAPFHPTPRG
jgi:hypothetical protein